MTRAMLFAMPAMLFYAPILCLSGYIRESFKIVQCLEGQHSTLCVLYRKGFPV